MGEGDSSITRYLQENEAPNRALEHSVIALCIQISICMCIHPADLFSLGYLLAALGNHREMPNTFTAISLQPPGELL